MLGEFNRFFIMKQIEKLCRAQSRLLYLLNNKQRDKKGNIKHLHCYGHRKDQ